MTIVNYYRIYNIVTLNYEYVWSQTEPTQASNGDAIDSNLTVILDSVSNDDVSVTNGSQRDSFGVQSMTGIHPIFQSAFTYGIPPQRFKQTTTGLGNITTGNQMVVTNSGAASSSSANLSSLKNMKYAAGEGILARFSGIFSTGITGNTQRIGLLTDSDGIGFGYNGTDFGIYHRNNSVDMWIPQSTWNLDPMNGLGPSGTNINFGDQFGNVFQLQMQYLGFGGLIFYVEDPVTATFTKVHVIKYANTNTIPSFLIPSFPLCIESSNTTNTTNVSCKTGSMMAALEGENRIRGARFIDSIVGLATNTTESMGGSWDILPTFNGITNRINMYITNFSTTTATNDRPHVMRFYKNATFTTPIWTEVSAGNSSVRRLTSGTWNGNGVKLYEVFIPGKGNSFLKDFDLEEEGSLLGIGGDNFVITFEALSGAGSVDASINWLEDM